MPSTSTPEHLRLEEDARRVKNWKRWGPYLAERQWGTVREDYSANGNARNYFPHDHARSRAYRWGEDGLLGISDRESQKSALSKWDRAHSTRPPQSQAGHVIRLSDGRLALAWNPTQGQRRQLHLAVSDDEGRTWSQSLIAVRGSATYPNVLEAKPVNFGSVTWIATAAGAPRRARGISRSPGR